MKRTFLSLFSAMALMGVLAMPVAAEHGGDPTVIVMQHLCNEDIQSVADFEAVEAEGAGGQEGGEGTLPGLVATVLACPVVFLPSDTGTGGIAADPMEFDYTVTDGENTAALGDSMFMAAELCESDIALDADGSGSVDEDVCLDVSMYEFAGLAEGDVTVTQTTAPEGTEFGTVRFTPASTDELALLNATNGALEFDTTLDTQVQDPPLPLAEYNDDVVVAHVYNFQTASTTGEMPDSATGAPASSSLLLTLLAVAGLVGLGGAAVFAVSRQRS